MPVSYLRTFCTDDRWPRGELNFPRAIETEKAYPEDEVVFTMGADADGPGGVDAELLYEKRVGAAGQVELGLPLGIQQTEADGAWLGGFPVTNTEGRSTRVIFYLLWEWFDGGFFDGW